jgi:hypothetical protein
MSLNQSKENQRSITVLKRKSTLHNCSSKIFQVSRLMVSTDKSRNSNYQSVWLYFAFMSTSLWFRQSCKERSSCEKEDANSQFSSFDRDATIDHYLDSLMKDHNLIMLPYHMGTANPKLFHLFGVDRVVVEEAIATLEASIQAWNQDGSMVVGHPIVYSFRDTKIEPSSKQPLPRGPASLPPSH